MILKVIIAILNVTRMTPKVTEVILNVTGVTYKNINEIEGD